MSHYSKKKWVSHCSIRQNLKNGRQNLKNDWANVAKNGWATVSRDEISKMADKIKKWLSHCSKKNSWVTVAKNGWVTLAHDENKKMADEILKKWLEVHHLDPTVHPNRPSQTRLHSCPCTPRSCEPLHAQLGPTHLRMPVRHRDRVDALSTEPTPNRADALNHFTKWLSIPTCYSNE
jgi:hypothetical protein